MTVEKKQVAHPDLVGSGSTTLHSHSQQSFPIGSVFLSVVSTNPSTLLGYGTWSQIAQGQFLVGYKSGDVDFGTVEKTGGAKTANLAHTHDAHTIGAKAGTSGSAVAVTAPVTHATNLSATQSLLNPYLVVYVWKRTA